MKKVKIAFAITSFGNIPFYVYQNHIQRMCAWTKKYDMLLTTSYGTTLLTARDECLDVAINNSCSHIFYVDSDVILPSNALDSLLSCDADLASGLCMRRGMPFDAIGWLKISGKMAQPEFDPYNPGVYSVEWVGGGVALFKTSIFAKLQRPYFKHVIENGIQVYEDVNLCKEMKKKDMSIVLDSRVQCGHVCREQVVYPKNAAIFKSMYELIDKTKT